MGCDFTDFVCNSDPSSNFTFDPSSSFTFDPSSNFTLDPSSNEGEVRDKAKEDDLTEPVAKGAKCESKDLYHARMKEDPEKFHWVDTKPFDMGLDKGKTKKERESYAVNVFRKYREADDEWAISQIKINSPKILVVLERILEGYPGLTQHSVNAFSPPFLPFVHRWPEFEKAIDTETDGETLDHLRLLHSVLIAQIQDTLQRAEKAKKTRHVAWSDLDLVFNPSDLAYQFAGGFQAVGVFRSSRVAFDRCAGCEYYSLSVDVIDWDGRRCGCLEDDWRIYKYVGLHAFTALDVSPLAGHSDEEKIRASLIARGRQFEKLRGQFFMAYTNEHDERINERMIIDARAFHKYAPKQRFPNFASINELGRLTWAQSMNRYSSNPVQKDGSPMEIELTPLTDEQCLLAVPEVKCFDVENKKWQMLDLTKFHDIPWSTHAFDSLVLDAEEKDLLLALVDREELKNGKSFDDFISGKGQGMIMLLCGPPGVGKTLTAESVAEHLQRPLYKIGAGDLGITAHSVEECLDKALKLCAHWGAVLLLDEADVFMEARTANNIQRNELVSVFLRLLEYYSGIMILTTNRMRSIDTAFESRIDITLTYDPLTEADRKQVWKNFIGTLDAKSVDIDDAAVDELAKWDFNGRQIKSAIKTARILAAKKKEPLNTRHLNVVLTLRSKALGMMDGDENPIKALTNGA